MIRWGTWRRGTLTTWEVGREDGSHWRGRALSTTGGYVHCMSWMMCVREMGKSGWVHLTLHISPSLLTPHSPLFTPHSPLLTPHSPLLTLHSSPSPGERGAGRDRPEEGDSAEASWSQWYTRGPVQLPDLPAWEDLPSQGGDTIRGRQLDPGPQTHTGIDTWLDLRHLKNEKQRTTA